MKILIEMEIEHCKECPFKEWIYEQGYSSTDCRKLPAYSSIPVEGIRKDCPFLKKSLDKSNSL